MKNRRKEKMIRNIKNRRKEKKENMKRK